MTLTNYYLQVHNFNCRINRAYLILFDLFMDFTFEQIINYILLYFDRKQYFCDT